VHAIPMRLRGQVIGAVNIFNGAGTQLDADDVSIGQALADVATIGLLQERNVREARVLSEQLQSALNSRIVIEQAKGLIFERRKVDMDEAFELLRGHSRKNNQRLSDVAQFLLDGALSPDQLGAT